MGYVRLEHVVRSAFVDERTTLLLETSCTGDGNDAEENHAQRDRSASSPRRGGRHLDLERLDGQALMNAGDLDARYAVLVNRR